MTPPGSGHSSEFDLEKPNFDLATNLPVAGVSFLTDMACIPSLTHVAPDRIGTHLRRAVTFIKSPCSIFF